MKAMILAAGFGSRLRPITDEIPKPLIDVGGHPMIAYPLAILREAGIEKVIINLHHHGERLRDALGDGSRYGVSLTYSDENPILDTGGGIKKAEWFLQDDTFVVLNGDTIMDLDLRAAVDFHRDNESVATMVLRTADPTAGYGVIEVDADHRIRRFLGKPAEVSAELAPMMFTGVHIFEPRVFDFMGEGRFGINSETYPAMLAAGEALYGYPFAGFWSVLDTHPLLAAGRAAVASGKALAASRMPKNAS